MATALHRRMTASEIEHIVGERVFRSFYPKQLYNFDAEAPRRPHARRPHRPGRGRRDQHARRRVRPARLREHQPGRDGRRAQVGRDGTGRLSIAQAPPQRRHDAALAVLHGPARGPQRHQRLDRAHGPPAGRERREGLPDRDDAQQRDVPGQPRLPQQAGVGVVPVRPGPDDGGEEGQRPRAAARAPGVLPPDRSPVQADRHQRGRGRGRPRADPRQPASPAARRGERPVRRAGDGPAVPGAVQRELDPEPDPRALPGPRVPLQHVPEQAAREAGWRGDPASPRAVGVQPDPPPLVHRLLRGGPGRDHRPQDHRVEVRGAATRPTRGTSTCTARRTPTTACTRSTCGTGARTAATTPAT